MQAPTCLAEAGVQPRLITRWREVHSSSSSRNGGAGGSDDKGRFVSDEQRAFFGFCASWKDILFTQRPYPTRQASACKLLNEGALHGLFQSLHPPAITVSAITSLSEKLTVNTMQGVPSLPHC